jgi:hypothetical protein
MHNGHYGHPSPADDHSSERSLDDVWSFLKPQGNTLKWSMMLQDSFGIFGNIGLLIRERQKSLALIQKLFKGFNASRYICTYTNATNGIWFGEEEIKYQRKELA